MFRNVLAAALRNLMRNRLYAGITIFGLAVAFAAGVLIALFVRDDYSYDRFIPGHAAVLRLDSGRGVRPALRPARTAAAGAARDLLLDLAAVRDGDISTRAIDVQISRLRRKLSEGDPAGPELIRTLRGRGYMFMPPVVFTARLGRS